MVLCFGSFTLKKIQDRQMLPIVKLDFENVHVRT